jgi:hypothetical protein
MLRFLARFLAVVFALVFVVGTVPIVFFQAAGTRLTQPQVYKEALTKERLYDRLPALVADTAAHAIDASARVGANGGGAVDESLFNLVHQVSAADWEMIFGAVLPASYVRQQIERALDQFFTWLHSNPAVPVVNISLGELKQRLLAPETEETYVRILQTKPPCTASQLQAAGGLPFGCCPSPEEMPRVRQAFRTMMQTAAGQMPETVNLFEKLSGDGATAEATRRLAEVRTLFVKLEWLAWWSPAVPAALLLLIAVFAVRSFRGWMFWWGIPCLIVGAVSVVLALPVVPAGKWIFADFVVPHLPAEVPAAALDALAGLVLAVLQSVMNAALHSAGALAIGGLVAVILGAAFKSRPKPAMPLPPQ